ncbi:MAG: cobalt-precorrin 5A hydrolase [Leptospirillia bacterium]
MTTVNPEPGPQEMKLAVATITRPGLLVAARIARDHRADLYVSEKYFSHIPDDLKDKAKVFDGVIKNLLPELFSGYDGIILIMALGIVVRSIARLAEDKTRDPAVLVGDVQGRFMISVLSGHSGGANKLTEDVARTTGALPVITTGTDVSQTVAPDMIAKEISAVLTPHDNLKRVSSAIVDGDPVLFLDLDKVPISSLEGPKKPNILVSSTLPDPLPSIRAGVYITISNALPSLGGVPTVQLIPRCLGIGIGCNRGTSVEEIEDLLIEVMERERWHPEAIRAFGSIDLKKDEEGILQSAARRGLPLYFFSRNQLEEVHVPNPSGIVKKYVGTPAVAEPSSLLALRMAPPPWPGRPNLVVEKVKSKNATLAIARWTPETPWEIHPNRNGKELT